MLNFFSLKSYVYNKFNGFYPNCLSVNLFWQAFGEKCLPLCKIVIPLRTFWQTGFPKGIIENFM
jgi:hypothetical protein